MYSPTSIALPVLFSSVSFLLDLIWRSGTFLATKRPTRPRRASPDLPPFDRKPHTNERQRRPSSIARPVANVAQMELTLSTHCCACGNKVSVDVPKWITDSIDAVSQSNLPCDGSCGHGRTSEGTTAVEIRGAVVGGVVSFAQAVRASPALPFAFATLRTFVAMLFWLDATFSLRQRAAAVAGEVMMGLVEIEKEVGIMRNAGEGLSIGWEALVKGVIAFVKTESAPSRPVHSIRPLPNDHASPSTKSYPYSRFDDFDQSTGGSMEPTSPSFSTPQRYLHPAEAYYRDDPRSTILTHDLDDGSATLTTSTPVETRPGSPHYPPLRRVPLSSPNMRTTYLGSGSMGPPPSSYYHHYADSSHLPSYSSAHDYPSSVEMDSPTASSSTTHRRSRSGPDNISSATASSSLDSNSSAWPTRTVLGWADKLMMRTEQSSPLQQPRR
ncbi:hypothetical protein JCM10212_006568 [Sporobolomyces blumeae]